MSGLVIGKQGGIYESYVKSYGVGEFFVVSHFPEHKRVVRFTNHHCFPRNTGLK